MSGPITIPCGHTVPQDGCPHCLLFDMDPFFRQVWSGGKVEPQPAPTDRSLACIYLGQVTNKMGCECPGRWKRGCSFFKREVTISGDCRTCQEYDPK